ncbi:MAG: hypothetical protein EB070_08270 [Synechococcaceae bacterium WBA_2_066]|nr:hypothetical protein [Synechococcaceae bacterium WBA_2_066]
MTGLASAFATIAVLPLIFVIVYVLFKGISVINPLMFVQLPPPPGLEGGGIGNALLGTLLVTLISVVFSVPVGVGGGIYLAEFSLGNKFSEFVRFGTNVTLAWAASFVLVIMILGMNIFARWISGFAQR